MYNYQNEKPKIFTESGQVMFLKIRDNVQKMIKLAGAVTMSNAIQGISGSSWEQMACVDRLLELGEIVEVIQRGYVPGQNRIFVAP